MMATTMAGAETYVLGHSAAEQRRLDEQGAVFRPFTERLLREAGIGPEMRVLDAGCGTGDVTLLAAKIVGPNGAVVGIDRSAEVLATARNRAEARGLRQASFVQDDIATMTAPDAFDAVVGRLVLMYQADPAAVVRQLAATVRPGGALAFIELVIVSGRPWPGRPLFSRTYDRAAETFVQAGADIDMGLRLPAIFLNAGLPRPHLRLDVNVAEGADAALLGMLAGINRSLLPAMERFGVATVAEVEIDTLFDRLVAEAAEAGTAVIGPTLGGAWVRTPLA